jgi:hypothetical protein
MQTIALHRYHYQNFSPNIFYQNGLQQFSASSVLFQNIFPNPPLLPYFMKNLFFVGFFFLTVQAFAQENELIPNPTLSKMGETLANGMCDCFNTHALPKLSSTSREALEKLAKKGVMTKREAEKMLSIKEMMALSQELETLMPEEGEFAECQTEVSFELMGYQGQIAEIIANKVLTEEELEKQTQLHTIEALRKNKDCQVLYCLTLIK